MHKYIMVFLLLAAFAFGADDYWVKSMKDVHKNFKGKKGTVALYGDSITYADSFWTPISENVTNPGDVSNLNELIKYISPDCWDLKGEEEGNKVGWEVKDGLKVIDSCLKARNPETAIIMFGTNDLEHMPVKKFISQLKTFVDKCLANGTIAIISTVPPYRGKMPQVEKYDAAIKEFAKQENVPLIEFYEEIIQLRPTDWDGTLIRKDDGVHPTKGGDDWSEAGLKKSGFGIRNYVTIKKYGEVYSQILKK